MLHRVLHAIADDDAFLLWFVAKSSFLPKNRRKLQENHNVFNECSRQNADALINSGRAQSTC